MDVILYILLGVSLGVLIQHFAQKVTKEDESVVLPLYMARILDSEEYVSGVYMPDFATGKHTIRAVTPKGQVYYEIDVSTIEYYAEQILLK